MVFTKGSRFVCERDVWELVGCGGGGDVGLFKHLNSHEEGVVMSLVMVVEGGERIEVRSTKTGYIGRERDSVRGILIKEKKSRELM